jgi:FKBP-type peptidyl-prolyl cis-trans isomerase SlyD
MNIDVNCVVSLHYTLTNEDGVELDSSIGNEPLVYLHGAEGVLPGLERELAGKAVGDKFVVVIRPEEGYGDIQPDLISVMPREGFQGIDKIEPGMQFNRESPSGETQVVVVTQVSDSGVTVDANHPLAGQVLNFDVSIEEVRAASAEEVEHGHPH